MMNVSDRELLSRFVDTHDEGVFRELVDRHLPLVLGVARRVTLNEDLAGDVAQQVFVRLARGANRIPEGLALAAWLHRVTHHLAIDLVRSESRRKKREAQAQPMSAMAPPPSTEWTELSGLIDTLVNRLPGKDRDVVLLRYFENRPHREIARQLGISEAAAKKRAIRALDKLRAMLERHGIASATAALATLLPAHAATPVPASLVGSVLTATHGIAPASSSGLVAHLAMTTAQKTAIVSAAVVFLTSFGYAVRGGSPGASLAAASTTTASGISDRPTKIRQREPASLSAGERLERIRKIIGISDRYERMVATLEFISLIEPRQFAETLQQAASFEGDSAKELSRLLVSTWAKVEPLGAVAWAIEQEDIPDELFACWAEYNPDEAMDWVLRNMPEALTEESQHRRHLVSVVTTAALDDPAKAVELIGGIADPRTREQLLVGTGSRLMSEGPDAYEALVAACGADSERNALVVFGASWMIRNGRAKTAFDWFVDHEVPRKELRVRDAFRMSCVPTPDLALKQLDQLPETKLKDEAVAGVCLGSVQQVPTGKLFELLEQYPGAKTDAVVGGIVDELPYREQLAELWRVENPDYREELQEAALISWATGNPDGVNKWMEEHPVSDAVRTKVLKAIEHKQEP